jgi:hypothetical protein
MEIENSEQKLLEISTLIRDFTKTGEEMLNASVNSKEILKTDLPVFLLFRQTLEMGDAMSVLINEGCVNATKPLIRSLLECYYQLAFLLENDAERKGLQFLYHYEMRQKEYFEKLAFPEKGGSYFEKLKKDKHLKGENITDEEKTIYLENISKINTTLEGDDNKDIAEEYLRTEQKKKNEVSGKKGKVSNWYELYDGPSNIEAISIRLEQAGLYQFIYRDYSKYTHSEDIVHTNLESYDDFSFKISELRDLRQLTRVANDILLVLDLSCVLFLKHKSDDKRKSIEKFLPLMEKKEKYYLARNKTK